MWPFNKRATPFTSWPIVRTKPRAKTYGRAIQLFINKWQSHLTTVDVFSDGVVDCWGFVDLSLLRSRSVVPSPIKVDQHITVLHFGMTGFRKADMRAHLRIDEKKELLRQAYARVPEILRCYCGDMDTRDTAIREALYGDALQ